MKKIPSLLSLLLAMSFAATVVAQPSNDDCTGAISLGTLPAPAACGASTGTKSGTAVNNVGLSNVGATPENPYPYNPSCPINTASFPDDVWYSFVASSYQVVIKITGATFTNPIITLWEGNCTSLGSLGCVTGAAGAATLTVVGLIPGTTYYIQVSGLDGTQTGTFNMKLTSQTDCDNCLVASQASATPPPTNGYYAPGTTVTFCDSIYSWNETSNNWLHGAIPSFGSGWNLASLVAGTPPVDCNHNITWGTGYWAWYPNGDTSSATGNIYGPGFYYENDNPNPPGVLDNDPGNNYGDNDPANTCTWVFCVTITTNSACVPGSNLDMSWQTTGDGESGGWTSAACANDPINTLYAVGACCPPTMTSTAATCASPTSGTATATPIGTTSPWTFQWSNGTTQTLTGPSTITGLSVGIDTVTVTDALGCTSSATVNVSGPAGVNGGPDETVTCASLPGGTATMAATGAGTWTAQAGNPGTATITSPTSPTTTITTFSAAGVYTFLWTVAGCSVPVTVTVTAKPNAGPDQSVLCATLPGGTATMAATGTGTWTAQAGNPGTATITTPGSPTTTITAFSAAGTYNFIWTNGSCTDVASVTVTAKPNAGPDQSVLCATLPGGTATMAATGTGTWTAQAGNPGTATITTPTSPTTTITAFSAAGTYNFIWTNGTCTDVASITVTAKPNAGPDQSVLCATLPGGTATMAATGTGTWTAQAGNPGTATITTPGSPTTTITNFSAAGTYNFIWTNGTCTDVASVTVTAKPNAGPDQNVLCATLPGGTATMAATGTGTWTAQAGNPGTATITTATSPTTTITNFSAAGTYNFIWTNGTCTDVASVTVTAEPNAGPDQSVLCATLPGGTATMAATGTGTWTAQAGNPGTATITTATSPTTTITNFSAAGTYNFIWTNGTCTDVASVKVTAEPNAGPDQSVLCATLPGGTATMAATGTGTWTAQAGNPGTATITTPASPTTTITAFSAAGTYNFIWTNGTCTDVASVTVTGEPNAGPDQSVLCATLPGGTATMAATGTGTWTAQAGNPGTATITTPGSPTTTITNFSAAGTYNFIWTNGTCTDVASVTVTAEPNAGPDQSVLCATLPGGTATMAATGTGTWTAQAGNPGTATITTPGSPTTTISTFSAAGTYNFIWTNGTCTDVASVTITAEPNAGPDQSVLCATLPGGTATMAATGTGTWTAQAGNPGTATITTATSPTTTITNFSAAGTYNFIWTNGTCTDVASVTVTTEPNAGPDQSVLCATLPGGTATMAATGTGTWIAQAGNPGTATITVHTSPTTTITAFSASGTYNFIWTNGTCTDVASVTVTAEPNAGPDQNVLCATLPGGTATMAATGTGTWTAQAGNPGTATITTATSPTTTITNFSAAGTYNFIWTNGTCTDVASVIVTAEPNAGPDQNVLCATLPGGTATMAATGTGTWTAQAGNPGTATITTATSPTTTITNFSAAGTYNFIWTNGTCTDVASVTVTAEPNAGPNQSVLCATLPGGTATMAATGTGTWTAQAGNPGTATITTPTSPTTTITAFSAAGTYNFIWTNGTCTDVASVTVTAEPNAGPDQNVLCATLPGGTATMAATGTGTWTAQAGNPGTATITAPNSPTTTITAFSAAGTYNFIWTNGTCTDVASVTVTAKPNAGPDQNVLCVTLPGGTATMAATGTGTWTAQAGNPGTATITTATSPTTTITNFSAAGTYNFIWTNGTCTDVASVTVTAEPNAGPDQNVLCATLPGGTATMAATGTGTWTAQAGNPGTATITTPASPTTTITTFSDAGTYNFIWTNGTCTDVASVTVTAEPNAGPDQNVLCATLPGGTATMAATGTGTWTAQAGNPGTATITSPASPTTTITTFSAAGTYNFIWTNGTCTDVASVTVTAEPNAGPDQNVLCATLPGGTATMAATGTGTWTAQAGNPGTATITTPTSPTTTITAFSAAGTYNFIWTNGTCTDVASVTVTAEPNAGPDQNVLCATLPGGTATMAATGSGTWTAQAGNPGAATITTANSPTTTITNFSAAGTYNFIWTNGTCTDVASVTVTAEPNAGPNQSVLCATLPGGTATMAATGTGTWTAQAGNPGTATITTPNSPTTTITTFSAAGTYNFIWTNGTCTDVASVTVTAEPNAGPDQNVLCATLPGGTATMAATGTGTWTAQAGNPGTATITTPASPTTTITTFSAAGTYNFIWTNGTCTDVASVTVTAEPNAGPDQNVLCATLPGGTATMAATGTGTWTAQAGNPGTATITTPASPTTTITTFSAAGTYNFIWTNGTCTDVASVTVTAEPNAGPDQSVLCATLPGGTATMAATGTGTWTAQAGNPGTATITTPASPTTTITTFSAAGTYNFIWTNGTCTDVASVTVTAEPNAGPDQSVLCATLPGGTATMAATGTGTWTAQAGNPGTATITTATSPTTTITNFSAAGTYNFIWTNGTCTDVASVTVTAEPNAGPDQNVLCATLPGGTATMAATGTGTWTAQAGNPGTATITTPASPTTTITNFSAAGTYNFVWTNGTCTDVASVTVTAEPNAGPDQNVLCATLPGGTATMAATGTGTWTAQAGNPGTATITTPTNPTTTITAFSAAGTYNFIWTNGTCTDVASVTVTAEPNAGPDQNVLCATLPGGTATMAATGTGTWTAQAGNPGTATITTPTSPTTTITTFSAAGTYNFIWTNGTCTDVASVTVTAEPNAGPDQSVLCATLPGGSATMAATGTGTWTAQAGNPGTATITTASSPTTTITNFSAAGTYNFIWTNGTCTDVASVTVTAEPNAGPDQNVLCATLPGGIATMAATGTGTWTAQAGNPGTATITTATSPTTTITTFSAAGTYNFIWTNGTCTDIASVTVTAEPNAGPDQSVLCATLPGGTATMAATGTGTWTAQAGNPGTTTITTATSPTTTITNFSAAGTYNFVWTNGTCTDVASVTVTAEPNAGPDQSVLCATLPGGTATMAATGTGTWTAQAGNPGTATITTPSSPTTTITTFSAAGTYNFIWTNGTCTDVASITVTAEPNAGPDQSVLCATLPGGSATMAATGTGTWTAQAGNPGTATITTPTSPTTTITTFSAAGTYNFIWTNGTCTDVASVTVTAEPNAGPDQSVLCATLPGGTATMAATGTGTWTAQAGNPGTATITTPGSPTTTITTFSAAGTYNFIWTNGTCTDVASVTVTAEPNAGPDQSVLCATLPGGTATMAAIGTGTWTAQAGNPGTATITTATSPTTTITNFSAAGTYNFIWTNGTCTDVASVTVTAEPNAGPDQNVLCATLPGGTATMAATGTGTWTAQAGNPGTATITTPGSPTTTISTFSAAGTYNFIWTNGTCTDVASVTITAEPNAGPDQNICINSTATMAAAGIGTWSAVAGNPATVNFTNPNSNSTSVTGFTTTGVYTLQWTVGACSKTMTVTVHPLPTPSVNDSTVCSGVTATLTATGGVSYVWSTTATTPSINTTTAGTYFVTATDVNGCSATASGTVTVNSLPTPTVNDSTVCSGVTATLTATGGVSYVWSTTATTPSINTTTAGTYIVTATDVNGCSATASGTVTVNSLPTPTVNDSTVCSGVTATLTATGGVSYVWSTTAITPSINTTTAGTYFVTATDVNGCSATASGTVTVNNLPTPTVNDSTVCSGVTATLIATGGVSYVWSTTATTSSINTTTAGTYFVTATDINGCSATASGTVTVNNLPTPTVNDSTVCSGVTATLTATGGVSYVWSTTATTPSINTTTAGTYIVTATDVNGCSAAASGTVTVNNLPTPTVNDSTVCSGVTATLTATGGVSYVWSTTATTPSINTTTAGTYIVTATDINGCSATASGTVTVNSLPTPTVNDSTVCSGVTATLTATGGVSYVWSTTATTPSINTTTAGTYFVTATDINGCSATASGTVTVNNLPTPTVNDSTVCSGVTATLTATGGVSYVWSTTATTPSINTTTAGTYFVTATDVNGCSATASGTVTVNNLPTPSVNDSTVCSGVTATLNATGGVSYVWSTTATTPSISTTTAGTYFVTATDINGCSATASGTVTVNNLPTPSVNDSTVCSGVTATLTATGGVNYVWSTTATTPSINTTTAGTYFVTATDINGCSATASGTVTVNNLPTPSVNDSTVCSGVTATLTATGGVSYVWSTTATTSSINTTTAGTYFVTATDVNGCSATASGNVTVNNLPTPTVNSPTICPGATATLTATGGVNYLWSTTATTASITTTTAGTYFVTVTDINGCSASADGVVTQLAAITFGTSIIDSVTCFGGNNGSAQVMPQNGIGLYSYQWSDPNSQTTNPATNLAAGSYTVTVTDGNGCTATASVTISQPSQLSVGMGETDPTCAGYNNGTASATASGGIPPYSYVWNNTRTTPALSGLTAGTYTVTATDANGCTASGATGLTQPASINESLTAVRTNCPNSADGSIADTVSGGVVPYTFTLESAGTILQSGNTTGIFSPLGYGLYTVIVQDQNGCQVSDTISVPRAPFDIYTATADSTSCYGVQYSDGIVHVQGYTIPNGPFQYSIDGGPFQYIPDFFNLSAGPHKITAQDNYGCDTTFTVTVGEPLPATVQILPGDSTITPGTSIQLSTIFSPYSVDSIKGYTWSPSDGLSCMDCPAPVASPYGDQTVYTVIITYNNGCTTTAAVQINTNGQPPVYIPNAFTPNGDGTNDVWFVFGTGIKDFRARIFNRWGEKIFESDNQSDGWDGTYKGQLQPPGVYVYLVDLVYLSGAQETKDGSVTMIR